MFHRATGKDIFKESISIGAALAIMGKVIGSFFGRSSQGWGLYTFGEGPMNYSIFGSLVELGTLKFPLITQIVHFMGALQFLGVSLMIYGSILALLFNKGGYQNHRRNFRILLVLILIILSVSLFLIPYLHEIWLSALQEEKMLKGFLIGLLVADTHPLLPSLSYSLIGCMFGMAYALKLPYKKVCLTSGIIGTLTTIIGGILYAIMGEPPIETIQRTVGPQTMFLQISFILYFMCLIYFIEMRQENLSEKNMLRNKFYKRFSKSSLTLYAMESFIAILIKYLILDKIFPGWASSLLWTAVYGIGLILLWNFILIQWKKINHVGSLEWILGKFKPKPSISPSDIEVYSEPPNDEDKVEEANQPLAIEGL